MTDPLGFISSSHVPLTRGPASRATGAPDAHGESFKKELLEQIQKVNELQSNAEEAIDAFATGQRNDIENVMLATQKADTAFRMLLQVRNKVMEAYEEVKQIRV